MRDTKKRTHTKQLDGSVKKRSRTILASIYDFSCGGRLKIFLLCVFFGFFFAALDKGKRDYKIIGIENFEKLKASISFAIFFSSCFVLQIQIIMQLNYMFLSQFFVSQGISVCVCIFFYFRFPVFPPRRQKKNMGWSGKGCAKGISDISVCYHTQICRCTKQSITQSNLQIFDAFLFLSPDALLLLLWLIQAPNYPEWTIFSSDLFFSRYECIAIYSHIIVNEWVIFALEFIVI